MKTCFILFAIFPFIMCNGQSAPDTTGFASSSDLKGKVWHAGKSRVLNRPGEIIFADDIYLHFLDKDSIQMRYSSYTPSVGLRTKTMNGIYQIAKKNEVSIVFSEPKDTFGRNLVSIRGKEVQFSLYAMSTVRNIGGPASDITTLPQIRTYHFKIGRYLADGNFMAELTLWDEKQVAYPFGAYTFDNNKTEKQFYLR